MRRLAERTAPTERLDVPSPFAQQKLMALLMCRVKCAGQSERKLVSLSTGPHPKSHGWVRTNTMKVKQERSADQLPLAKME